MTAGFVDCQNIQHATLGIAEDGYDGLIVSQLSEVICGLPMKEINRDQVR